MSANAFPEGAAPKAPGQHGMTEPLPVQPGEPPSFEEFVLAHGPELVAFARRLTLDHHRAEDIVQDVLARLGLSWSRMSGVDDVRSYAYKAVLNRFLSWRRRLSSRERPKADPVGRGAPTAPGADQGVVERDMLRTALSRLPPVQRAVLVLRYHQDLPDAAIAELLGCAESTVRSHARRALGAVRNGLPPPGPPVGWVFRTSEGSSR
jgi:RNA polymerase sigma-70 factor (sigma-E family)